MKELKLGDIFKCAHCGKPAVYDGTCHKVVTRHGSRNVAGYICGDCFLEHYDICIKCYRVFPLSESPDGSHCKHCYNRGAR